MQDNEITPFDMFGNEASDLEDEIVGNVFREIYGYSHLASNLVSHTMLYGKDGENLIIYRSGDGETEHKTKYTKFGSTIIYSEKELEDLYCSISADLEKENDEGPSFLLSVTAGISPTDVMVKGYLIKENEVATIHPAILQVEFLGALAEDNLLPEKYTYSSTTAEEFIYSGKDYLMLKNVS